MVVEEIHATIFAEASKEIIGRNDKLADVFTDQLAVASDHQVRGLGQDVGANVCNDHLVDPLLDSKTSLSISLSPFTAAPIPKMTATTITMTIVITIEIIIPITITVTQDPGSSRIVPTRWPSQAFVPPLLLKPQTGCAEGSTGSLTSPPLKTKPAVSAVAQAVPGWVCGCHELNELVVPSVRKLEASGKMMA